jgi:hypothetical protein
LGAQNAGVDLERISPVRVADFFVKPAFCRFANPISLA